MTLPTTTVSGLISGLDTGTIIQQLMYINRAPIRALEERVQKAEAQQSALQNINTAVGTLKSTMSTLAGADAWAAKQATSSNEDLLTVEATSEAQEGAFTFRVVGLAQVSQHSSNGYADSDTTPIGAGQIDITVGTNPLETIDVSAADTLDDVATKINGADIGVKAMVINDGSGATPYRLMITSETTGSDGDLVIATTVPGLSFNEIQDGVDAHLKFGEGGSAIDVYSSSNTVTELVPGLTLDLHGVDAATDVTVTVSRNTEALMGYAEDFVTQYNNVQDRIGAYTGYDEESEAFGVLFGNQAVLGLSRDLAFIVADKVDGLPEEMNLLLQAGFHLDSQGVLSLDGDEFTEALDSHFDSVVRLFSESADVALGSEGAVVATTATADPNYSADGLINGNTDSEDFDAPDYNGFLSTDIASVGSPHTFTVTLGETATLKQLFLYNYDSVAEPAAQYGIRDFTIEYQDTGGTWHTVKTHDDFTGSVTAYAFPNPVQAQAVRVNVTDVNAADELTRFVEIKAIEDRGAAKRLDNNLSFVTSSIDGTFTLQQDAIDERIEDMNEQIEKLGERLEKKELALRREFTAMEQALAQMQSQSNYFAQQSASWFSQ